MLVEAAESIAGDSSHGASIAAGAAGQLLGANPARNGLYVQIDPATAATTPQLYLLLASSGTPSPTNFDVVVTANLPWNGLLGNGVYRGAIQYKWAGSAAVGVSVIEF
jgi:hypothetical protein